MSLPYSTIVTKDLTQLKTTLIFFKIIIVRHTIDCDVVVDSNWDESVPKSQSDYISMNPSNIIINWIT